MAASLTYISRGTQFSAIIFNTLLCLIVYLPSINATEHAGNNCCRVAILS